MTIAASKDPVWQQVRALMPGPLPTRFPSDTTLLFPPRDNASGAIELLANAATAAIVMEMFTYCDTTLDAVLHTKAATAGFTFQATFDESQALQESTMAKLLAGWASDPRVVTGKSEHNQIVHRKVLVFDHLYVASGSTNLTYDGEHLEDNELIIRRNKLVAGEYEQVLNANHARIQALHAAAAAAVSS